MWDSILDAIWTLAGKIKSLFTFSKYKYDFHKSISCPLKPTTENYDIWCLPPSKKYSKLPFLQDYESLRKQLGWRLQLCLSRISSTDYRCTRPWTGNSQVSKVGGGDGPQRIKGKGSLEEGKGSMCSMIWNIYIYNIYNIIYSYISK